MATDLDILILGGGLVGCSLACALEDSGYRVGLVEASAAESGPPGFDERKLALSAASVNALSALGVLTPQGPVTTPIQRIHVSRDGDFGSVRLAATDAGRESFGSVVLARDLGQALETRVAAVANLQRLRPATVVEVARDGEWPRVRLATAAGESVLTTRLLVAADGTRSLARTALGIASREHDYRQTLLVCTVACDRGHDGTAYERFTAQGPVALLPMAGGHYGGICAVASDDAAGIAALNDRDYADYFQQRFGWRAGRVRRVGTRSAYPLRQVLAERLDAPRAVLVGNAAQTIHPIGAQGFNLGLRDALSLSEVLDGGDPGSEAMLVNYVTARREDRERTLAFSDGLARATANDSRLMSAARSLGLLALGRVPALTTPLASGAMGFRGRVPALARDRS